MSIGIVLFHMQDMSFLRFNALLAQLDANSATGNYCQHIILQVLLIVLCKLLLVVRFEYFYL